MASTQKISPTYLPFDHLALKKLQSILKVFLSNKMGKVSLEFLSKVYAVCETSLNSEHI